MTKNQYKFWWNHWTQEQKSTKKRTLWISQYILFSLLTIYTFISTKNWIICCTLLRFRANRSWFRSILSIILLIILTLIIFLFSSMSSLGNWSATTSLRLWRDWWIFTYPRMTNLQQEEKQKVNSWQSNKNNKSKSNENNENAN